MKTLIIIRHSDSNPPVGFESDFARSLSDKGKKNAAIMAEKLFTKISSIDAFIVSAALRTSETAAIFEKKYADAKVVFEHQLYHASESLINNVIEKADDKINILALIGHNPGLTDFVNSLTSTKIDHMPPCGVFVVKIDIDTWKEFEKSNKEFFYFGYPNQL